ncbi:hypothetical protein [Scopulibacillus darangshiensis]|uniref:hypothetical protein n=1 Tax=Scopulibacillus darangshiensis TaxID=442528 RepID=UPI00104B6811|nr:hypothetical protein [Scopulibacillus darangshiensis]
MNKLYNPKGYYFGNGFNISAIVITFIEAFIALIGEFVDVLNPLYQISWFVGTVSAFGLYLIFAPKQVRIEKGDACEQEEQSGMERQRMLH